MEKVVLTFVGSGRIGGDTTNEIYRIGHSSNQYCDIALQELRYACGFTSPSTCKPGYEAAAWRVDGYLINNDSELEQFENVDCFNELVTFKFKGKKYLVPNNYYEFYDGASFTSDEIRKWHTWSDYKKYIGMDVLDKFEPNCNGGDYPEVVLHFEGGISERERICRCGNGCSNTFPINKLRKLDNPTYGDYLNIVAKEGSDLEL